MERRESGGEVKLGASRSVSLEGGAYSSDVSLVDLALPIRPNCLAYGTDCSGCSTDCSGHDESALGHRGTLDPSPTPLPGNGVEAVLTTVFPTTAFAESEGMMTRAGMMPIVAASPVP